MSSPSQDGSPVQGGRPLLRGRILGFPVHLDLSFVIVMGVIGYNPNGGIRWLGLWLLITPLAVLVHELGHAVMARAAGAQPEIALAGFGGVTTFTPPRPLSRVRSLGISLAGPLVGLLVGGLLLVLFVAVRDSLISYSWQDDALQIGIWTCLGWSVLNLLPILPLDGGQAMRELLPGSPFVRTRRAAGVSIVIGALVAVVAYVYYQQPFIALFMVLFVFNNVMLLRQSAGGAGGGPAQPLPPERAVVELLWQGQPAQAREVLGSLPPSTPVDLAVHGAVLALTGDRAQGHALLTQEIQRRPGDQRVAALLVLTLTLEHDWDAVIEVLQGPVGPSVPRSAIDRAISEARGIGREDVAGRLTVLTDRPVN